jgi:glycosyltransferase involved in cell wall biosynthesis
LDVIVVDGKSDDKTLEVVKYYAERAPSNISIRSSVCNQRNVSIQRNQGAKLAAHDTLIFMDADTAIPKPENLDELVACFTDGEHAVASCRFMPLEPDPRAHVYYTTLYGFHKLMERTNPYALGACIITTKDVFQKCAGFDHTIKVNEDANFCLRASYHGSFRVLPVALHISTRRFSKHGYVRMGLQYLRIFLDRTFRGETRDDRIQYEFGKYD